MTFLVKEEVQGGTPTTAKHWLTEEEIALQPKFVVEASTVELLKSVGEKLRKNEAVYPCEVLECVKGGSEQRKEKRRETERTGERPQLVLLPLLVGPAPGEEGGGQHLPWAS